MDVQAKLIKEFTYNKKTGIFTKDTTGRIAGKINRDGDIVIRFGGRYRLAKDLAWLYEYGKYSFHELEHINGNKQDNRISNLNAIFKISNLPVPKEEKKLKRKPKWIKRKKLF